MKAIALRNTDRVALVDDIDFDAVMACEWTLRKGRRDCFYAFGTTAATASGLHRFIAARAGITGRLIDHEDRDGLNNTRGNLRGCTHAQNAWNTIRPTGASGVPGVCKNRNNWAVRFDHEGTRMYFGTFRDLATAERVAIAAMTSLRGEFMPKVPARVAELERGGRLVA